MSILRLKKIRKTYQKGELSVEALKGVDLEIEKGEFLAIVGPSGSGKSTALNILGCLDSSTSGSIIYDGKDLSGLEQRELAKYRKQHIGFIFQSYNLIPVLTVKENVELPLLIDKRFSKSEREKETMRFIEAVGLKEMAHRTPRELSGGQEQRVAIARALVKKPLVVLADEPTANLDSHTSEDIIALMQRINSDFDTTFIFSTHDELVMKHAKRIVVLKDGMIDKDEVKA